MRMRRHGGVAAHDNSIHGVHHRGRSDCLCRAGSIAVAAPPPADRSRSRPLSEQPQQTVACTRGTSMKGIVLAVVIGLVAGGCKDQALPAAEATQLPPERTEEIATGRRTAITSAVDRVAPSVVTVQTEVVERVPADVFEQFFGGRSGTRSAAGLGSGFIVREDGVILTNAHVVNGASRISVALKDGLTYPAKLLGADETNDLAVIKIEAKGLPVAPLGNSSNLLVGEWAIAIGNPYGFMLANTEPSVTAGVVSGTGRNLAAESQGGGVYVDMIQTDASINPGNSGGPLVNALGEVIGVNSSIFSPTGSSIGLGFAIPINRARRIAE